MKKQIKKTKKIDKDKPVLLVKLGDAKRGWLPSADHYNAFSKMAQQMGLADKFNIILYHYGITVTLLDTKKDLKKYGLVIVDEKKFKKMLKINVPMKIKGLPEEGEVK